MSEPRIAVPLTIAPGALAGHDRGARVLQLGGETMGTVWRVRLAAPAALDLAATEAAIVARLDGLVAEMSHWLEGSLLDRFNRLAGGRWLVLPTDFATVMAAALEVAERSGGAFDPAIGRLVDLWGFGPVKPAAQPDDDALAAALALSGWRRLAWDGAARRLRQPGGLSLDLSGIAKGHAVDAVADLLAARGLRHALVEIGGECAGRGLRPDGEPWWVDCEEPPGATLPPLRIALHELAVATSGDYVRGAHTIDPRTGQPATGTAAVSVLHASAMWADAWASALAVLDPAEGAALAEAEGLAVRRIDSAGAEWISPALAALL